MVKLTVNRKVLIRTPRFPFNSRLADRWPELKVLIQDSSPAFYDIIKDMSYEELSLTEPKVRLSLQKYFNRACFRSTPYGGFAAVGITELSNRQDSELLIPAQPDLHAFADWSVATDDLIENVREPGLLFFANSSYYRLQDEIRFIQRQEENYIMSAVDYDPVIRLILENCPSPTSYIALSHKVGTTLSENDISDYLSDLINLQLIFTNKNRNIIGEDYFLRTKSENTAAGQYVIAERKSQGAVDQQLFRHLPELAFLLQKLAPSDESAELQQFKERFLRKFEQQEVPLMLALDLEAGVGYGDMAQHEASINLEPFMGNGSAESSATVDHPLKQALLRYILEKNNDKGPLRLEKVLFPEHPESKQLPNSLTAGCTIVDDLLFLDFMGGVSANSIYGRFAHAIPEIKQYCKEIAAQEQAANPGVLFFDVGYTKEPKVDNINRRPAIYDLQLNILNFGTSENPLVINDIYISIPQNEVVLRSRKLNTRLLPRLATAYNYQRSDLPLFRLLMDIQTQGLATSLQSKIPNLLPGLPSYPRIQYKNIVVSPASWLLQQNTLKGINVEDKTRALREYLLVNVNARYIKTGLADQTLLLDVLSEDDLELLVAILEKEKAGKLLIEEAAIPAQPIITDDHGSPYLPQVVLTLQHEASIGQPLTSVQKTFPAIGEKQWVPPGADWLYFEIYCSPYRADELLNQKVSWFLEVNRGDIHKWFFIRYNENGDHIRFRLQLVDPGKGYALAGALSNLFAAELLSGIVSDIKLCTYKKEVHRYGTDHMSSVESHFYRDSEFVLSAIREMLSDDAKYNLCIELFNAVADTNVISQQAITHFLEKITDAYNREHGIKPPQFKELNHRFKTFLQESQPSLGIAAAASHERLKVSLVEVIAEYPVLIRPKVLGDLLHMHINRLFVHQQRLHETIFYNFLLLHRKRQQYMQVANL